MTKKMMKRILSFVLVAAVSISVMMPVAASPVIHVFLDGVQLRFEVAPRIMNGRTVVPLRDIFEALGAEVEWDGATQTVTATRDDTVVVLTIGSTSPTVNGRVVTIDQAGVVIDGRTLVPLRFVGEAFGIDVEWNSAASTIIIGDGSGVVLPAPAQDVNWAAEYIRVLRENETEIRDVAWTEYYPLIAFTNITGGDVPDLVFQSRPSDRHWGSDLIIYSFSDGAARRMLSIQFYGSSSGMFVASGGHHYTYRTGFGGGSGLMEISEFVFDGTMLRHETIIRESWYRGGTTYPPEVPFHDFVYRGRDVSGNEFRDIFRNLSNEIRANITHFIFHGQDGHTIYSDAEAPNISMTFNEALQFLEANS